MNIEIGLARDLLGLYTYGKKEALQKYSVRLHMCVHKHELYEFTMTRTLSKHRGYLNVSIFVYQSCWLIYMYDLTAVANLISFSVIYRFFAYSVSFARQYSCLICKRVLMVNMWFCVYSSW